MSVSRGVSDPTLLLAEKMNDPAAWDDILDGVPIFKAHEAVDKDGNLKYRIDDGKLQEVCDSINRNWEEFGKPLKIFIGHTRDPKTTPQTQQPPLIGYGIEARIGTWGPKKERAILTKWFVRPGHKQAIEEYPERSPEFFPGKNEITAVALLKTDPRLNMGMLTYERTDGAVLYMRGFEMPVPQAPVAPVPPVKPDDPTKTPDRQDFGDELDIEEGDGQDLTPEEAQKFMAYMKSCAKYGAAPMSKFMGHFAKRYGMEMPSGTNTAVPAPAKPGLDDAERVQMHRTDEIHVKYQGLQKRVEKMERDRATERAVYNHAMSRNLVSQLVNVEKIKMKSPEKEIERMSRLTDPERLERFQEIRENYAREDSDDEPGDPHALDLTIMTAKGFLPTYSGGVEGGDKEPQFQEEDIDTAVAYCEENHLDASNNAHWDKAMKAVMDAKKPATAKR